MTKTTYENVTAMCEAEAGSLAFNGHGLIYYPAADKVGSKIKIKWTHVKSHRITAAGNPRNLLNVIQGAGTSEVAHTFDFLSREELIKVNQDMKVHVETTGGSEKDNNMSQSQYSWRTPPESLTQPEDQRPLLNGSNVTIAKTPVNQATKPPPLAPPPKPQDQVPLVQNMTNLDRMHADESESATHHSSDDIESETKDECKTPQDAKPVKRESFLWVAIACLVLILLFLIVIPLIACSAGDCFGLAGPSRPIGEPSSSCMSSFASEWSPQDPLVYTPKFFALRDYSVKALKNTSSPQSRAYYWTASRHDCSLLQFMPLWQRQQLFALASAYYSLGGEKWESEYDCGETSVSCETNGKVTSLELSSSAHYLKGTVPPEVELLSSLVTLQVEEYGDESVALQDVIPWRQMRNLEKLSNLTLSGFSRGFIPSDVSMLNSLVRFVCYSNGLSGSIPSQVGLLKKLQKLQLSQNNMTGMLTSELGSLTELTSLSLTSNRISGPIPSEVALLTDLTFLSLGYNNMTESIPAMGSLRKLQNLNLSSNRLSESIPTTLGQLTELRELDLSRNLLSGGIPLEIASLTNAFFGRK